MQDGVPLLLCEGLTKRYGALTAVKSVSLTAKAGEILGIAGPNGAGKTTLFDAISGHVPIDEGRISLAGLRLDGLAPHRIFDAGLARTFQLNAGWESLTVAESLLMTAAFRQGSLLAALRPPSAAAREAVAEALELTGLKDRRSSRTGGLPVLDRKRLMIATALIGKPKVLMLDEPVGGLTEAEIGEAFSLFSRLAELGLTLIVIEHVMSFLLRLAPRIVVLHHGEKIFDGRASDMPRDPAVVSVYLGQQSAARLGAIVTECETAA